MRKFALWMSSLLGVVFLATCAPKSAPPPEHPYPQRLVWADGIDWEAARDEAVRDLSAYLQVNTANPPGNEAMGAAWLRGLLEREGIEVSTHAFAPGRENLVARLRSANPEEAPLCLMSHIDVVPAEAEKWTHPPFSGLVDADGMIWGRGALDMKSVGLIEAMAMIWMKRLDVPLRRDVILLAVGDEEVDNRGVKFLAEHHWDDIGCTQVLNEGGMGVHGALVDDLTTFAVSFTEKGALWLRMHAEGEPGHGSTPMADSAPARLMAALEAIDRRKDRPSWHPEMFKLLHAIGERAGGITGAVLKSPPLTKALAKGQLMGHPLSRAILTNTINVTGFGGAEEPNVVPSRVFAQLDIRMLPGVTSDDMLAELEELTDGIEGISFEILQDLPAVESPTDDPVYLALTRHLQAAFPEAAVGPLIMPGTTDSQVLRALGVHCYGFAPFAVPQEQLRGMHGDDERLHGDDVARGLQVMLDVLLELTAVRGVDRAPAAPAVADAPPTPIYEGEAADTGVE